MPSLLGETEEMLRTLGWVFLTNMYVSIRTLSAVESCRVGVCCCLGWVLFVFLPTSFRSVLLLEEDMPNS